MIKQAILITAYKDFDHIGDIIDFFPEDRFTFFIHIDKKSVLSEREAGIFKRNNVNVYRDYVVNWGGVNHLKCILLLAEKALEKEDISFFHLISGQDFPVKNVSYFEKLALEGKDYIEAYSIPRKAWPEGGLDRLWYYSFYDVFNMKKKGLGRFLLIRLLQLQRMLKLKRKFPANFPPLHGGATWWSLTRETLRYVINYTHENSFVLNRFTHTFNSEEFYFQTVLMNSHRAGNIINDDLRYMDWKSARGGYPALLDMTDYDAIMQSDNIFARKFDSGVSVELKKRFQAELTDRYSH